MDSQISSGGGQREIRVHVPAKVNLALAVGPTRPDGFHELATIYQAVDLIDVVSVGARGDDAITVDVFRADGTPGPAGVPRDTSNLAVRAAELVRAELARRELIDPDRLPGVDLRITKSIPVAGGMAGGSADAAAALVACHELWGGGLGSEDLAGLAARLGSDVPFLLHGRTAAGSGRGEAITPVDDSGRYHWVFVTSEQGLSTPQVYREYDRLVPDPPRPRIGEALLAALAAGDTPAVGAALSNDLTAAAVSLRPELGALITSIRAYRPAGVLLSGSGPTVAILADDAESATRLVTELRRERGAKNVHVGRGPATGARVYRPVH